MVARYMLYTIRSVVCMLCCTFLFTTTPALLNAQLCTGNLGDPIVNIDFGEGYNPGLPASATSYGYSGGCPSPGKYAIASLMFGCDDNTWFLLAGDHTRSAYNSNYMVVNAAGVPGTVITQTTTGLCGNTTYEFAAWIANVMQAKACSGRPALPSFTFTVETLSGAILASYDTGDLPVTAFKTWNQYGVFFTTPADINTVVLTIKCNSKPGCGSVFTIDDITLKACGPLVSATLDGEDTATDVCAGYSNPFILNATYSPGFTDPLLQWQSSVDTGKTWQDIPASTTTTYTIPKRDSGVILYRMVIASRVNFNSPQCRIASNALWTNVHPLPLHRPTADLVGCLNKDFVFPYSPGYILNYQWSGPNGFNSTIPTPTIINVQYKDTGIYSVLLTADFGCAVKDSFYLHAYPSTTITALSDYSICEGQAVQLTASGNGSYTWTPSAGLSDTTIANPVANPGVYTQYKVLLTNGYGCKDSAFVNVYVNKKLEVSTDRDKQIMLGDTVIINASVTGTAVDYYWTPQLYINNIHAESPLVYPPVYTEYMLHASSGCGSKTVTVKVRVLNEFDIPNAFTPNGDGLNDLFRIESLDSYTLDKFLIYNRWGTLIFQTTDQYRGWDGNVNGYPQSIGVYIYFLQMHSANGKRIERKGTVTLLR